MTLDAFEAQDSQRVKVTSASGGDSLSLRVFVSGTDDRDEALREVLSHIANVLTIDVGLPTTLPVVADAIDLQPAGHRIWLAEIEYVSPEKTKQSQQPRAIGEVTFEFDGTGGTMKITEAFEQRTYGAGAVDFGKSIAVGSDNKPEGVEIAIPSLSFTLHQKFEGPTITLPWLRTLASMTGTVNQDTFLGFDPGEVLFLGPSGQQPLRFLDDGTVAQGERDVTFRFSASPNVDNLTIDGIPGIKKAGHEYLWCQYKFEQSGNAIVPKAKGVYVAEVYRKTAFASLGINDPDQYAPVAGA